MSSGASDGSWVDVRNWKVYFEMGVHIHKKKVTIQQVLSREVFWHVFAKIPRHTRQNAITEGDLECILTRNCEGTEQLQ